MKIIFNKYGGLKTIEDRQLLVQSSDNANYVDIYYQNDDGTFADETVNLATIAFKRSDTFEISERTCDAVREELTNKILYFRYVFLEDELAVNGELQMTVRLKQVVFDPEDDSKVLLIKQRAMGKITAHIYEAIGGNYENFDVVDGRILQLELWQATFESDYYNADQIDAKLVLERQAANDSLDDHNASNTAHDDIRQTLANNASAISSETLSRQSADNALDGRIDVLEAFKSNLDTDITEEIENAVADKADLVNGKVPREQMDDYFDDIIEGFYINQQFYSEGEENEDYLITPELGKLYVEVDTNVLYRWIGAQYEKVTGTFELTKAKIEEKLTGDITSHNHATEISNHDAALSGRVTTIETALPSKANLVGGKVPDSELPSYSTPTEVDNKIASAIASTYVPKGSLANITGLPTLQASNKGFVYNIASAFTTTTDFIEGAGKTYPAGTNIVIVEASIGVYKWDVLSGFVDLSSYALNTAIPTKTSDLTNDSGFLTALPTHNHTKSEITDFPTTMTPTAHQHTKSEITDFPTIPTVPTISTNITTDATSDTTTTSPKAVKTYVDNAIDTAILGLLGGES